MKAEYKFGGRTEMIIVVMGIYLSFKVREQTLYDTEFITTATQTH